MVLYRGKYDLKGLDKITSEMEADLDAAFAICQEYKEKYPCEMCGKCCHQPNITVRPGEVDRVAAAAGVPLYDFMRDYIASDGVGGLYFKNTKPCKFLGKDNRCKIWKDRPEICDDFPYEVSMFMSRIYLALTNEDANIMELIDYMDDTWPCTKVIKETISERIDQARKERSQ